MKYSKHWKLELFISIVSIFLIPLIYLLFSPFFGQILFVPLIFGILPIVLIKRYHYLICYPLAVSLVYSIFLLSWGWTWPPDLSLIPLAFGSILIPTIIGYLIGFFYLKFGQPNQKWLMPIHCLTSFILVYVVTSQSLLATAQSSLAHLYTFLILPLVFIGSQGLISYLYPSNRFSPLATAIVYQIINGFVGQGFISWTTFLYLALAYGTLYLIVVKIKEGEWDRNR